MFTLLNTRPAHQAENLAAQLAKVGVANLNCPLLEFATTTVDLGGLQQEVWVFVSRNAVEHFAKLLEQQFDQAHNQAWFAGKQLVAVGEATAQAIEQQGWQNLQPVPNTFDSEGMIELPAFSTPKGLSVAIVRANGGRPWLAENLQAMGASVDFYEVYERRAVSFCNQAWLEFKQAAKPLVLFTSVSNIETLLENLAQFDEQNAQDCANQAWLRGQTLIVFSERIAQAARDLGFSGKIYITEQSSDPAIIKVITENLEPA